jgi:hypothetical protein
MTLPLPLTEFKNAPIQPVQDPKGPVPLSRGFFANSAEPRYTEKSQGKHDGVDIKIAAGTPVFAVANGKVIQANVSGNCGAGIIIEHSSPHFYTYYCHLSAINVKPGDEVFAGLHIGRSGGTKGTSFSGDSTGPHLHFELRVPHVGQYNFNEATRVDPLPYITEGIKHNIVFDTRDLYNILSVKVQNPTTNQSVTTWTSNHSPAKEVINEYSASVAKSNNLSSYISPFITSLQSFHKNIQYELTRRRFSSETVNTYMPFVKLTSLLGVKNSNLDAGGADSEIGAYYPSLGLSGHIDNKFEDIYNIQNNKSIVGYAIKDTAPYQQVPVIVEDTSLDPPNIPMPGVVSMNVERNAAGAMGVRGGLMRATIKIAAYSIGQIDTLLTYFLRPGTNVILEIGRQSSNPDEIITPYNWKQPWDVISNEFNDLIKLKKSQSEFIKKYVYDNNGRYELFIGYVVKFDIKVNKDNFYDIELTVHSVQQFEIPHALTGVKSNCNLENTSSDIHGYFNDAQAYNSVSFASLMDNVMTTGTQLNEKGWKSHVIKITSPTSANNISKANSTEISNGINGYYVTWRFFVEVILNDSTYGILALFPPESGLRDYIKSGLICAHTTGWGDHPKDKIAESKKLREDYLISNEVGYHPNLRSTNPGVMVIINTPAQSSNLAIEQLKAEDVLRAQSQLIDRSADLESALGYHPGGSFDSGTTTNGNEAGSSFLTNGIWINSNAIKESFTTSDTVSQALQNLLVKMNGCTQTYWNLQLLSADTGFHVIDYGLSKNSKHLKDDNKLTVLKSDPLTNTALSPSNFSEKNVFVFNKKLRPNFSVNLSPISPNTIITGDSIGGDLLDMKLQFNLPNVVAVQVIANVGGLSEKSSLQVLNIPELHRLSVIKTAATCGDIKHEITQTPAGLPVAPPSMMDNVVSGYMAAMAVNGKAMRGDSQQPDPLPGYMISGSQIREYADFGTALKWIELNIPAMVQKLNIDSIHDDKESIPFAHAFNSSNLTKATIDLTLPGIAGISLFQSFLVDKVPTVLDQGYYRITKVSHEFSIQQGWITKLTGRFVYVGHSTNKKPEPKEVSSVAPSKFRGSLIPPRAVADNTRVTPRTTK